MKITVELTEEQANDVCINWPALKEWNFPYGEAIQLFADAIRAQRPRPLQVGDKVKTPYPNGVCEVFGLAACPTNGKTYAMLASPTGVYMIDVQFLVRAS